MQCLIVSCWHQGSEKRNTILSLVVCCDRNDTFHPISWWIESALLQIPPLSQVGAGSVLLYCPGGSGPIQQGLLLWCCHTVKSGQWVIEQSETKTKTAHPRTDNLYWMYIQPCKTLLWYTDPNNKISYVGILGALACWEWHISGTSSSLFFTFSQALCSDPLLYFLQLFQMGNTSASSLRCQIPFLPSPWIVLLF